MMMKVKEDREVNPIGIMQGRLSPPAPGRLQTFPWSSWKAEFLRARECGFDSIEWIFESERCEENPIWRNDGVNDIRRQVLETGVQVRSLCADYFMDHPFFRVNKAQCMQSVEVLKQLIIRAAHVGIKTILLPVLEQAEINIPSEKEQLIESLTDPLHLSGELGISLGLETELPAWEYRALVELGSHPALAAYYDMGNSIAKGYDIAADVCVLGPYLHGVHVKDRKRGGPSVLLGQGDADFAAFFCALSEVGYTGPLILQTAFGDDYMRIARTHREFVESIIQTINDRKA